jgi:pyruvate dehydrogenase E1 component alpha subunit
MGAHTTSDDPTRYRIAAEVEEWKLKDPIARVRVYLSRNGLADQAFFDEVEAEADRLAAHVRQACLAMPDPPGEDIFAFTYREPHALVEEERAWFTEYQAGFADADEHAVPTHGGAR